MKFYKLENSQIQDARHSNRLDCYYADGETSYYASESNEELNAPFVELKKSQMPKEFIDSMRLAFASDREFFFKKAKEKTLEIETFKSSVLGEEYIYDFTMEDQVNMAQAREYSRELGSVGIRATRAKDGVKDNYLHTHEQISSLFDAWYGYKTKILNAFSEFKIELKNADTRKEIEKSFSSFENKIKEQ